MSTDSYFRPRVVLSTPRFPRPNISSRHFQKEIVFLSHRIVFNVAAASALIFLSLTISPVPFVAFRQSFAFAVRSVGRPANFKVTFPSGRSRSGVSRHARTFPFPPSLPPSLRPYRGCIDLHLCLPPIDPVYLSIRPTKM